MASYSVFYPNLLLTRGRKAISELKEAKEAEKSAYPWNHHRLDSLPAVAAAHLLPVTVLSEDKEPLCKEIAMTLKDDRREVQEIVLQNLITATSPNVDTLRFFTINQEVLNGIKKIITEAQDNEKLLTPATLCAEFLLNARVLLHARKAHEKEIKPYSKLIAMLRMSRADHFWYVSELVRLHEATFAARAEKMDLLLPQSTEALMGWKRFGYARDYLSHLALIRARLIYTNLYTADGKIPGDKVMTADQSKHALPKAISFYRNFGLHELIDIDEAINSMPKNEQLFKDFLRNGVVSL